MMTGGGFGEFISFGEGIVFNKLELTGIRGASAPAVQTVTFAYVADTDIKSNDNVDFNSYGFLNATEEFITNNPDLAQLVVNAYEKARIWALENPEETAAILAE